ncbi:serine/threonine protein kinase [Paenibacillus darwinianus]|uniref:Serine/threonine protein kinase n=1 Tax=Paenibacillus darwinianus TaxID=1380763 RepID=A0A9W5S0Z4_9BACL|nr:serine/threonine protein kinase [Paenibacillus darwinianus]EXX88464.1 serine/threonine protein kinase [Paenibacillus darwinianus]EXX89288.1 serine/threonine protein kinase [Paenibacillus darwinianus]EXX90004.1 serine/threonine protein kinase [Paenibacillus darwinianus]
MRTEWTKADKELRLITVTGSEQNEPVVIAGMTEGVQCIGIGTDAAVFTCDSAPGYAFKLYSDIALNKKEIEAGVYERLAGIPYFPHCFGDGRNYLVLSLESGTTLYDCLVQGVPIPEQAILDVEEARALVRSRSLNPRDIHLKNVILQNGRGKVLDVSEYVLEGNDNRWEHLVWAYRLFYKMIEGRKIPVWALEAVKNGYVKLDEADVNLEAYAQRIIRLFPRFMK